MWFALCQISYSFELKQNYQEALANLQACARSQSRLLAACDSIFNIFAERLHLDTTAEQMRAEGGSARQRKYEEKLKKEYGNPQELQQLLDAEMQRYGQSPTKSRFGKDTVL